MENISSSFHHQPHKLSIEWWNIWYMDLNWFNCIQFTRFKTTNNFAAACVCIHIAFNNYVFCCVSHSEKIAKIHTTHSQWVGIRQHRIYFSDATTYPQIILFSRLLFCLHNKNNKAKIQKCTTTERYATHAAACICSCWIVYNLWDFILWIYKYLCENTKWTTRQH